MSIRVGTLLYRRHEMVDIQPYVPSIFAFQFGFAQGIVGRFSRTLLHIGTLQDARNAWDYFTTSETGATFDYPAINKLRTAGYVERFCKSFLAYRNLYTHPNLSGSFAYPAIGSSQSEHIKHEDLMGFLTEGQIQWESEVTRDICRGCQYRLLPEEVLRKLDEADVDARQLWEEHQARDRAERQARGEGTSTSLVEPSVEIHHEGAAEDPTDGDEARILTEEEDDATREVLEILVPETTTARAASVDEPTSASREIFINSQSSPGF